MKHHQLTDELQEKAMLYASGAMDEGERAEYARHLEEDNCSICRAEVGESEEAAQSLVLMLPLQTPSPSVKQRLVARAEADSFSGRRQQSIQREKPAFAWLPWLVAAAALLVLAVFINTNRNLREQVANRDTLMSPSTRVVNLAGQGATVQARARIYWNEAGRKWTVFIENLPSVSDDRSYQLWFVPPTGTNPVSAKVFNTTTDGSAEFEIAVPLEVTTLMAAAVTVEPAGGSPQPTTTNGFALLGAIN